MNCLPCRIGPADDDAEALVEVDGPAALLGDAVAMLGDAVAWVDGRATAVLEDAIVGVDE